MKNKKTILKECCDGKGGEGLSASHIAPNIKKIGSVVKEGASKVYNAHINPVGGVKAAIKGYKSAYDANMDKYKKESGINKSVSLTDKPAAMIKGAIYGAVKGIQKTFEQPSEKKGILKQAVKMSPKSFKDMKAIPAPVSKMTPGDQEKWFQNYKKEKGI